MGIIMLSGYAGSGKDTLAKALVEQLGYKRIAFADVLKDIVAKQYDVERSWFDRPEFKEKALLHLPVSSKDEFSGLIHNFMFREFRTMSGQRFTRDDEVALYGKDYLLARRGAPGDTGGIDPLYWTPRALAILEGSVKRSVNSTYWVERALIPAQAELGQYVVTDFRYKSEYEAACKFLGLSSIPTIRIRRFETTASQDPSERDLDSFEHSYTLANSSTQEAFITAGLDLVRQQIEGR